MKSSSEQIVVHERNLGFIQRDFINPKNLGFMKIILVCFGFNIVMSCVALAVTSKEAFAFQFDDVIMLLNLVFEAISFWLIWRRKKAARVWVIGFALFNIVAGIVYNFSNDQFYIASQAMSSSFDIVLILYFAFAKRVKICLDQPFSLETYERERKEDESWFKPKTWPFWRNLIVYFCVFSVVGHWMEAGYCTLIKHGILPGVYDPNSGIWRDYLSPFMVYGFGVVACVLIFYPLKLWLQKKFPEGWKGNFAAVFITFVVAGIVCCMIELAMGLMMNTNYELWDYREMFCNFMGQICLQNGIAFGMVATLMTWIIYPALERLMSKIPKEFGNGVAIAVVLFFTLLWLIYCFQLPKDVQNTFDEQNQQTTTVRLDVVDEVTLEGKSLDEIYAIVLAKEDEARSCTEQSKKLLESGKMEEAKNYADQARKASQTAVLAMDYYQTMKERQQNKQQNNQQSAQQNTQQNTQQGGQQQSGK